MLHDPSPAHQPSPPPPATPARGYPNHTADLPDTRDAELITACLDLMRLNADDEAAYEFVGDCDAAVTTAQTSGDAAAIDRAIKALQEAFAKARSTGASVRAATSALSTMRVRTFAGLGAKGQALLSFNHDVFDPQHMELAIALARDTEMICSPELAFAAHGLQAKPSREILECYKHWLDNEHRLLTRELYPNAADRDAAMGVFYMETPAESYHLHGKNGEDWRDLPPPSSRASAVLKFVGCRLRNPIRRAFREAAE